MIVIKIIPVLTYFFVFVGVSNPITLNMVSNGASFSRSFNIKVTQIYCNSLSRAEDGCLQYYTGTYLLIFN